MQQATDRSLRELQRETEQTRAGLTHTVDQLKASVTDTASEIRQRISPEHIKAEVSNYVRSKGESMLEDITAAARRNPMQAVAVGASLAYPLLRFARSIPLPVLMVGAGLFFAGSKSWTIDHAKSLGYGVRPVGRSRPASQDMSAQVGVTVSSAKDAVSDAAERVGEALSAGADQVRRTATSATAEMSLADRLKDTAASVGRRDQHACRRYEGRRI